jgi:pyroglutamyl-peptidase
VPPEPTPAAYHKILVHTSKLIEQFPPDLVIHMGLDVGSDPGVFKLERSAPKEGYHDIPDIDRKVFTRAENKKMFAKAPASLVTTLDVESAAEIWKAACSSLNLPSAMTQWKEKGVTVFKNKQVVDVRLSDDVGTYVCGFQYYASMLEAGKRTGKRDVVFLHMPKLETKDEERLGIRVVTELIKALVAVRT